METTFDGINSGASEYDKNHGTYRTQVFLKYLKQREKDYINQFRFEGDDDFTRQKQRVLLKMVFRYGYGGIVNIEKLVKNKLDKTQISILEGMNINLNNLIKKVDDEKVPVGIFPSLFDASERPVKATGITVALHNTEKKSYSVDKTNCAILAFDDDYKSGYWWYLLPAYIHATGKTVLKKRLGLIDAKLVNNKVNNSQRGVTYDAIYDIDSSFVELAPAQSSITGGKDNEIDIAKMLDTKLKKLDMSNGETINDILQFVEDHEKSVFVEMGKRVNVNDGKQERSISMDFESMEVHWRLKEKEHEDYMETFIEDYQKIFGKQLTLVTTSKETIDKLQAQELAKSGRDENGNTTNQDQTV